MVIFRRSYVFVLATFPSPLSNFQFKVRLKGLDRGKWSFSAVIMRLRPVGPAAFLGGHEERRDSMKQTSGSAGFSAVTMRKTSCAMRFFLGPNEQTSKRWSLMLEERGFGPVFLSQFRLIDKLTITKLDTLKTLQH